MVDDKLDTEKTILQAARNVFIRKGLDGARMQEIADEAGINKALLHYYFRSKDKLFQMVFREALSKFFPSLVTMLATKDLPFEKRIEAFVENYLSIIRDNPFIPAFVISELNKNPEQLSSFFVEAGIDTKKVSSIIKDIIAKEAGISDQEARHLVVNIIAMSIFPFVGRPLIERIIFQSDKEEYDKFLEQRKKVIVELIAKSLKKSC